MMLIDKLRDTLFENPSSTFVIRSCGLDLLCAIKRIEGDFIEAVDENGSVYDIPFTAIDRIRNVTGGSHRQVGEERIVVAKPVEATEEG